MIGLMTLWFGPFVDLPVEPGYFYLCPPCDRKLVVPHLEKVRDKVAELHPAVHGSGRPTRPSSASEPAPPEPPPPSSASEPGPSEPSPPSDEPEPPLNGEG